MIIHKINIFFSFPSDVYAYGTSKKENARKIRTEKSAKKSTIILYYVKITIGHGYSFLFCQ